MKDLARKVIRFLTENPDTRFTAREIAKWIWDTYTEECRQKMERSKATVQPVKDQDGLLSALVAEIGSNHKSILTKEPRIQTTEERPRKYYFSEKEPSWSQQFLIVTTNNADKQNITTLEASDPPEPEQERRIVEKDLYGVLSQYLAAEHSVHSKRIDEKKSSNQRGSGGNHWLYPDMVGLEDLSSNWSQNVKDCAQQYGDQKACLWSFEVKLALSMSNARECFFQATSNSSWANYGYLAVGEITGKDTLRELQMLCSLHGIGLIRLNAGSPTESEIVIPAREGAVDWQSADRLARENRDFAGFVELITDFHKTGKIYSSQWDAHLEDEDD